MKKHLKKMITSAMLISFLFIVIFSSYSQDSVPTVIEIQVSPSTLNLSNSGQWVTVHADIAYGLVDKASVTLDGIDISWSKADNQGNFVAKFLIGDIKDYFKVEEIIGIHELALAGETTDGESFIGTYQITVINIIPVGKS